MSETKEIQIELRAIEPEDIDVLYKWENDKTIWEVSNTITPFSRYVLTKYIETAHLDIYQTKQLRLMIVAINDKGSKTVGSIDLFDFEPFHLRAGVGILIGEQEERGKGYASAALKKLKEYAFGIMKLNQLYCNIGVNNKDSILLFEKLGFERIGIKRNWNKTEKGYIDEIMFQCLSDNNATRG